MLRYAVEALYVDEGLLPASILKDFTFAMRIREGSDYGCVYSDADARDVAASASAVVDRFRAMLDRDEE